MWSLKTVSNFPIRSTNLKHVYYYAYKVWQFFSEALLCQKFKNTKKYRSQPRWEFLFSYCFHKILYARKSLLLLVLIICILNSYQFSQELLVRKNTYRKLIQYFSIQFPVRKMNIGFRELVFTADRNKMISSLFSAFGSDIQSFPQIVIDNNATHGSELYSNKTSLMICLPPFAISDNVICRLKTREIVFTASCDRYCNLARAETQFGVSPSRC